MSDYRCKVRIIHEKEITFYAKNKKEAEEEAKYLCQNGWGLGIYNVSYREGGDCR